MTETTISSTVIPDERDLARRLEQQAPSNLEWIALQPFRVDLPKTARFLREAGEFYGAPTGKAQAQIDRDRALAIAFGAHSPCALKDLNAFQSMSRFARSVGFVKVRPLTAENVAALTRPLHMNLAPAKPTRSE